MKKSFPLILTVLAILVSISIGMLLFYNYSNKNENNATTTTTTTLPTTSTTTITTSATFTSATTTIPKPILNLTVPLLKENMRWRKFPIYVYIDNETCYNYLSEINYALNEWNTKIKSSFKLSSTINVDQLVVVKCYPEAESYYLEEGDYVHQVLGEALPLYSELGDFNIIEGGHVSIYTTTRNCIRPVRYIHEFGHLLGLNHTSDKTNIMYPYEDCDLTIKSEITETLEKLCVAEVDKYVEYLYKTQSPVCPTNTTKCGGKCWPECSENYTLSCDDMDPHCTINWTKISNFDWKKFGDYKIFCYGNYYPPCEGNQMFVCVGNIAYCMDRTEFNTEAYMNCSEAYALYCEGHCQIICRGITHCASDKFYCEPLGNKTSTNTT